MNATLFLYIRKYVCQVGKRQKLGSEAWLVSVGECKSLKRQEKVKTWLWILPIFRETHSRGGWWISSTAADPHTAAYLNSGQPYISNHHCTWRQLQLSVSMSWQNWANKAGIEDSVRQLRQQCNKPSFSQLKKKKKDPFHSSRFGKKQCTDVQFS